MKKLSFLLTILLSLNIFTVNAYSNNGGSIIGTLNGVEYFADGNTAPIEIKNLFCFFIIS